MFKWFTWLSYEARIVRAERRLAFSRRRLAQRIYTFYSDTPPQLAAELITTLTTTSAEAKALSEILTELERGAGACLYLVGTYEAESWNVAVTADLLAKLLAHARSKRWPCFTDLVEIPVVNAEFILDEEPVRRPHLLPRRLPACVDARISVHHLKIGLKEVMGKIYDVSYIGAGGTGTAGTFYSLYEVWLRPAELPASTLNERLLLLAVAWVLLWFGLFLVIPTNRSEFFGLMAGASAYLGTPVIFATLIKDRWRLARRDSRNRRPRGFYLIAGLCASVIAVGTICILIGSWPKTDGWVLWLVPPFLNAIVLAWMADNQPTSRWRGFLRWIEAWASGASLVLPFIWEWSKSNSPITIFDVGMFLAIDGIGFVIGALIPTWYREAPRTRAAA